MSWNRNPGVFWGGVLVILGVLFLLGNTGVLTNLNWDLVWPLILIALGVWLLVARVGLGGSTAEVNSPQPRDGLSRARREIDVPATGGAADVTVDGASR